MRADTEQQDLRPRGRTPGRDDRQQVLVRELLHLRLKHR